MAKKTAKYGKDYEAPNGLQEDIYYEMMYDLMDYVNKKGLTVRQAQHLFADCFDMVLDVKPTDENLDSNHEKNISKHLESIAYSLDYFVFNDKRSCDKSHTIPD